MGSLVDKPTTETMLNPSVGFIYSNTNKRFEAWTGEVTVASGISLAVDITGIETTASSYTTSSVTTYAGPPVSGDSTMSYFRATGLVASAQNIKSSPGNLYGFSIINNGNLVAYAKTYEMPAANVNPGTTSSTETFAVPAQGVFYQEVTNVPLRYYSGLSVLATSTLSDLGTQVAPTGTVFFQCSYK